MTIEQDLEILKSVKSARQNYARERFCAKDAKMFCPICGTSCETFHDMINRKRIIDCPFCHTRYDVRFNREGV